MFKRGKNKLQLSVSKKIQHLRKVKIKLQLSVSKENPKFKRGKNQINYMQYQKKPPNVQKK